MEKEFEHFFLHNFLKVKSFAFRLLLSEADAEDVAQDIFIKLLEMPHIWHNNQDNEAPFLYTITRNHVFNLIKRRSVERKYQEHLINENFNFEEYGIEESLYAKELNLIATYVVEQMPEQRRNVYKMSRVEGKTSAEIATELNLSQRTVEHHIYLALNELKKYLLFFLFFIK